MSQIQAWRASAPPSGREILYLRGHLVDRQLAHAAKMAERAYALEAGAALDLQPEDARGGRARRRVQRARGAEQSHLRPPERRRDVHEAGVVAHDVARA